MLWECESSESVLSVNKRRNQLGGEGGEGGGEGRVGAEGKWRGEESLHSFYSREVHPQNAYVTG